MAKSFHDSLISENVFLNVQRLLLRGNGIKVNEDQAATILDLLYRVARVYSST